MNIAGPGWLKSVISRVAVALVDSRLVPIPGRPDREVVQSDGDELGPRTAGRIALSMANDTPNKILLTRDQVLRFTHKKR
jgi:hypothetical protein